jgi:rare lipoprotein A
MVEIERIPDAVPQQEPLHAFANRPYTIYGQTYTPLINSAGFVERGFASWSGTGFEGKTTASGDPYELYAMTAAHPTLPIPSYARVTNLETGKSVIVRINDRGPFIDNRIINLSYVAARKLDIVGVGTVEVEVESVLPDAVDPPRPDRRLRVAPLFTIKPK